MRCGLHAGDRGQATFVGLGICMLAIGLGAILLAVATVYIARAELQQAADLAASELGRAQGDDPVAHARAIARANGATSVRIDLDDGARVVVVSARAPHVLGMVGDRTLTVPARVREVSVATGASAGMARGGHYSGPLVRVDGATICPRVGADYRAMQRAASVSGVHLYATSGFRSVAEQAVLFAQLGPRLAAPPGSSLHHSATELDINVGPAGSPTHQWLSSNAGRFNFIQRYSWEPWHWGNVRGC